MSEVNYIEDIFETFYALAVSQRMLLSKQDLTATYSLYECCTSIDKSLTANQGNYLLKILSRHQQTAKSLGLDYDKELESPQWRKPFRVIDLTKRVFVEVDSNKRIWICLKFPFSLKEPFDNEIKNDRTNSENNRWDHDRKLRLVDAYKHNVIQINEFVQHHGFDIDDTFLELVSHVEEIWQQQDTLVPYAKMIDDKVVLVNATPDAENYFQSNRLGEYDYDAFLAKSMGFRLKTDNNPPSLIENICTKNTNQFWIKENSKFFNLYKSLKGKACIVLDRNTKNPFEWVKNFVSDAEIAGVKNDVKICFRESGEEGSEFNQWIKDQKLGGKVEEGKIYIFMQKPPKWLFKDKVDVKIIGTNCFVPPLSDSTTASWIFNHPCLCYLGEIKPTSIRNFKIVSV